MQQNRVNAVLGNTASAVGGVAKKAEAYCKRWFDSAAEKSRGVCNVEVV